MTAQEMHTSLNGPQFKTVQNELSRMVRDLPQPFAISGQATKGNPEGTAPWIRGSSTESAQLIPPIPDTLGSREVGKH